MDTPATAEYETAETGSSSNSGTCLVIAPSVFCSGQPYTISVRILKSDENDHTVTAEVRHGEIVIAETVVSNVKLDVTKIITLKEAAPRKLKYNEGTVLVRVETASSKKIFEQEGCIELNGTSQLIYVQMDKPVYQAKSKVRYRVVVLNFDMTPAEDSVAVEIWDPNSGLVQYHGNQSLVKGVYAGEVQLNADPLLGDWAVSVSTGKGNCVNKGFAVERSIRLKFDVSLKAPCSITFGDDLTVTVVARHSNGRPVYGRTKVFLGHNLIEDVDKGRIRQSADFDHDVIKRTAKLRRGTADVVFKRQELITFFGMNSGADIVAVVNDDSTHLDVKGLAKVNFLHEFKLFLADYEMYFDPGIDCEVPIALKMQDGTPARSTTPMQVVVQTTQHLCEKETNRKYDKVGKGKIVQLDSDGTALYRTGTDPEAERLSFHVRYDYTDVANQKVSVCKEIHAQAYDGDSAKILYLVPQQNEAVTVGEILSFQVKSTEPMSQYTFQVFARNSVVFSEDVDAGGYSATVSFSATAQMTPSSTVIVYAVRSPTFQVLVAAYNFKVNGMFRNKVSISANRARAERGDKIKVTVKTDPESFVGLLAVEESALPLTASNKCRYGYDVMENMVEQDVENCRRRGHPLPSDDFNCPFRPICGADAYSVFYKAQLCVLTDALLCGERYGIGYFSENSPGLSDDSRSRRNFPETWIWSAGEASCDTGEFEYETSAPDALTSWNITAFAISPQSGFGIVPSPIKLTTSRSFFIHLKSPRFVKVGEKFVLEVIMYNFMDAKQDVTVSLLHNKRAGFDFIDVDETDQSARQNGKKRLQNARSLIILGGGSTKSAYFPIVPTKTGNVQLTVLVRSKQVADAAEHVLEVKPEGYKVESSVSLVADLMQNEGPKKFSKKVLLMFPAGTVEGTEMVQVNITGDLIGNVLSSVGSPSQTSRGCSAKSLIGFAADAVLLNYLAEVGLLGDEAKAKAVTKLKLSYQTMLAHRDSVNPYNMFRNLGTPMHLRYDDSMWHQAFVLQFLAQASRFSPVPNSEAWSTVEYLSQKQKDDFSFAEDSPVGNEFLRANSVKARVALTAFVLISMYTAGKTKWKAVKYVEEHLGDVKDCAYSISLAAYLLCLLDRPAKETALSMLENLKIENEEGVYWLAKQKSETEQDPDQPSYKVDPMDIETTAYALRAFVYEGNLARAKLVAKWLSASSGSWTNSFSGVMALQALTSYALKIHPPQPNLSVIVKNDAELYRLQITPENATLVQSCQIKNPETPIQLTFQGEGMAIGQVHYSYYSIEHKNETKFDCSIDVHQIRSPKRLRLDFCCSYKKGKPMLAFAEIDALSGYEFDAQKLRNQVDRLSPKIQDQTVLRAELDKDDTKLTVFFRLVDEKPLCMSFYTDLVYPTADQKPAQFVVYEYNNPGLQLKSSYSPKTACVLRDICPQCAVPEDQLEGERKKT